VAQKSVCSGCLLPPPLGVSSHCTAAWLLWHVDQSLLLSISVANAPIAQIWPVLDPVVCELIRSTVEPLLDDMKPPFIAAMGFQKLTLGELPLRLEGIRVVGGQQQGKGLSEWGRLAIHSYSK